jgi:DsbC/DsbD-like thiol-disulfide interchange protein
MTASAPPHVGRLLGVLAVLPSARIAAVGHVRIDQSFPKRLTALAVLVALSATPAIGRAIEVVTVMAPSSVEVKPGAGTRIALQVVVKPGYHVQANPVENPSLIPITLKMDPTDNISVGEPGYPAAKRLRLPGDSQDLVVYDGTFAIGLPVKVGRDVMPGATMTLKGNLRYQACDDSHCLFPVTLPIAVQVRVGER